MFWLFQWLLYLIGGGVTLTAGIASYLAWAQPAFYFPKPTGQYAVGTMTHHVVTDKKELMIQLWYPAQGAMADKPTVPYAPYVVDYMKKQQTLAWLIMFSRPMYSYAMPDAKLVEDPGRFPVIIFSHGLGCTRNLNTAHCEELASHGYMVVGISHSFGCSIIQFPDGRVIAPDLKEQLKKMRENPKAQLEELDKNIDIWVEDVAVVLDYLEQVVADQASPFYDRLDMKHIGMFGHSYGGAAAVQLCRHDDRIKAGVNMDGALLGADSMKGFDKPCMFLLAEPWSKTDYVARMIKSGLTPEKAQEVVDFMYQQYVPAIEQLVQGLEHDVYKITLKDSAHLAFCDAALVKEGALFSRLCQNLGAGKLNGFRATEIVNAYLLNFFNKYLKGQHSELLDGKDKQYAEVEAK